MDSIRKLEAIGIKDVNQMLEAGRTSELRATLANENNIPEEVVLELVKLSDLARIPGIKGIRARLYHDAGIDSIRKLSAMQSDDLLHICRDFVQRGLLRCIDYNGRSSACGCREGHERNLGSQNQAQHIQALLQRMDDYHARAGAYILFLL